MSLKIFPIPYEDGKVTTAYSVVEVERKAIAEQVSRGEEFMKNAATGIFEIVARFMMGRKCNSHLYMVCGKGNNAGDAYTVGSMFLREGGVEVTAYQFFPLKECSDLCKLHAAKFTKAGGKINFVKSIQDVEFEDDCVILDGLFGSGFKGKVEGLVGEGILKVNHCQNPVIAIDISSGVPGDTGVVEGPAIIADMTICLGTVKIGHLYNQGFEYTGELHRVDFGISQHYIDAIEPFGYLINPAVIKYNYPRHKRTANKYEVGKVGIVGGSRDMPGAPILSAKGALRSGAGMVHLFHPPGLGAEFSQLPPEVLRSEIALDNLQKFSDEMSRTKALLIGPGLGRTEHISELLEKVYETANCPLVIDGDALFYFESSHSKPAVLTPHRGELTRLLSVEKGISDLDLLNLAEEFAKKHNVVLVCKGAPTTLVFPSRSKLIIMHGNVGMASGGVGDVLAGIIASIAAQGKNIEEAAILGATLHALAGDLAKETKSIQSMTASDLIEAIPSLFLERE